MATSLDFSDLISSVSSVLARLSEKKMAVYSGLGFLMDEDLPPPRYEYPVKENDKGLFVIIKNNDFKYEHRLEDGVIWKKSVSLGAGYKKDYNLLFKTFNLNPRDSHVKAMTNIVGECENELLEKYFEVLVLRVSNGLHLRW